MLWLHDPLNGRTPTEAICFSCGKSKHYLPSTLGKQRNSPPPDSPTHHGCFFCARAASGRKRSTPPEAWEARATLAGVEFVNGPPERANGPTRLRCRKRRCRYEWTTTATVLVRDPPAGCPKCAGQVVAPEEWLSRAAAQNVAYREGSPPDATTPWPALCLDGECGYEWDVIPWHLNERGCPECGRAKRLDPRHLTPAQHPARARRYGSEWVAIPVPSRRRKFQARCMECGHVRPVRPSNLYSGQAGCANCGTHGFDRSSPAFVYLLHLAADESPTGQTVAKVGVYNEGNARVALHERRRWTVVAQWLVPTGAEAESVETDVIEHWVAAGATFCQKVDVPRGDGFTESVWVDGDASLLVTAFVLIAVTVRTIAQSGPDAQDAARVLSRLGGVYDARFAMAASASLVDRS